MAIVNYEGIDIDTNLVKREDMPGELFVEIFDICGAETAVSLLNNMPNNIIVVPTTGMRKIAAKLICESSRVASCAPSIEGFFAHTV